MKFQPQKFFVLATVSSFMLLAACGQRGPLYHPVKPAAVPAPEQNEQTKSKTDN